MVVEGGLEEVSLIWWFVMNVNVPDGWRCHVERTETKIKICSRYEWGMNVFDQYLKTSWWGCFVTLKYL